MVSSENPTRGRVLRQKLEKKTRSRQSIVSRERAKR